MKVIANHPDGDAQGIMLIALLLAGVLHLSELLL
jgi:hypothetical protein